MAKLTILIEDKDQLDQFADELMQQAITDEQDIEYVSFNKSSFISFQEILTIFLSLAEAILFSAAYDLLKYGVTNIYNKLKSKNPNEKTQKIRAKFKGEDYDIEFNFTLSEEEREKLINGFISKMLEGHFNE